MIFWARTFRQLLHRRPVRRADRGGPLPSHAVDEASAREQMARILASPDFALSPRLAALLAYLCDAALQGRSAELRGDAIAMSVFGREASFDARLDPVVPIEMSHLRRALERYYLSKGQADRVRIAIPKGAYAPRLEWATTDGHGVAPGGMLRGRGRAALALTLLGAAALAAAYALNAVLQGPEPPRLLVSPLLDVSHVEGSESVARGLTTDLVEELRRFDDIRVVDGGSALGSGARYALSGTVDTRDAVFRILVQLVRRPEAAVIWAGSYEAELRPSKIRAFQRDIATKIAGAIGRSQGTAYRLAAPDRHDALPDDWAPYRCTLLYHGYAARRDGREHDKVRACLENTVAAYPTYATAWALLSLIYLDEMRGGSAAAPDAGGALDRARAAAEHAIALDPDDSRALRAQMLCLAFSGQREAALALGARAAASHPGDLELAGELAALERTDRP